MGGPGGRENFFSREKKFFPFPRITDLYQERREKDGRSGRQAAVRGRVSGMKRPMMSDSNAERARKAKSAV